MTELRASNWYYAASFLIQNEENVKREKNRVPGSAWEAIMCKPLVTCYFVQISCLGLPINSVQPFKCGICDSPLVVIHNVKPYFFNGKAVIFLGKLSKPLLITYFKIQKWLIVAAMLYRKR